ncbi:MAG: ABC transporter substrate-binding protein [Pseudomonadota bacterium]
MARINALAALVALVLATTTTTAAAAEQPPILIGRLGSLTSPVSSLSTKALAEGFDTYVKRVNAAGGVRGRQLRVLFEEDGFQPGQTVAAARKLVEQDHVVVLLSTQGTPSTQAVIQDGLLARNAVALLGPNTGVSAVLGAPNVFPVRATYEQEVVAVTRHMVNLQQRRVAYLHFNAAQGPAFGETFRRAVAEAGLQPVGSFGYDVLAQPAEQEAAIRRAALQVRAAKPDAVFVFAVGATLPAAMRILHEVNGRAVARYTFSVNQWDVLARQLGADARGIVISQAVPSPYGAARRIALDYRRDLQALSPGLQPSFLGLEGYLLARILVEGLRRAEGPITPRSLLAALDGLGRHDLGDYVVNFSRERRFVESAAEVSMIGAAGALIK